MGDKCGKFLFKKPYLLDFGSTWTLASLPGHLTSVNIGIGINRKRKHLGPWENYFQDF